MSVSQCFLQYYSVPLQCSIYLCLLSRGKKSKTTILVKECMLMLRPTSLISHEYGLFNAQIIYMDYAFGIYVIQDYR